jgi:hypothetical protein
MDKQEILAALWTIHAMAAKTQSIDLIVAIGQLIFSVTNEQLSWTA